MSRSARLVLAFVDERDGGTWVPEPHLIDAGFPPHAHVAVPRRSVDGIVAELDLRPDLIKTDLEGGEHVALKGATGTARRVQPRFHVEMHATEDRSMAENGELVLGWCRSVGYDAHYLVRHERITSVEPFSDRGRCHLLLLPEGTDYPTGLAAISQGDPIPTALGITTIAIGVIHWPP